MGPAELLALSPPGWGGALLAGLATSLKLAGGGYALGLVIGVAGAFGRLYGNLVVKDLVALYTTLVRAVPELVLIVLLYYAGNDLIRTAFAAVGMPGVDVGGMAAGILVIGVVQGAYTTEVMRGAILAVPRGQFEAARAFGMPAATMLRRVTLPAMLPHALPGLANLWLIATKDTALLAVVGFTELTLATRQAGSVTKEPLLFFTAAGVLYLAVSLVSTVVIHVVERRARRGLTRTRRA